MNLSGIAKLLPELSALSKKGGYLSWWFDSTVQTQTRGFFSEAQYFAYRLCHRNNSKFSPQSYLFGPALDARFAPYTQRFCRFRLGMFVLYCKLGTSAGLGTAYAEHSDVVFPVVAASM
jgi:hypothetical protein